MTGQEVMAFWLRQCLWMSFRCEFGSRSGRVAMIDVSEIEPWPQVVDTPLVVERHGPSGRGGRSSGRLAGRGGIPVQRFGLVWTALSPMLIRPVA